MRWTWWVGVATALGMAAAAPSRAVAQEARREFVSDAFDVPVGWDFGFSGLGAQPVGEFDDYVDLGGGFGMFVTKYLGERRSWGIRLDGVLVVYGSTTVRRPLGPTVPFVEVDVTTENAIASFAVGPHFMPAEGRIRPYVNASIGAAQFVTTTSVWGSGSIQPFASTENFEDYALQLTGGGGMRITLAERRRFPISLDVGMRYLRHGTTEYLREGGITELPDGSVQIDPIRSDSNLITCHVGVAIGVHPGTGG